MIVDGELRGKGIGTKLLEKTFETANLRKCKKIELDSGFHREQAHKFYEKIGFEKRAYLFSKDL
jgi:GNAT superfamily N-acetyltransferase